MTRLQGLGVSLLVLLLVGSCRTPDTGGTAIPPNDSAKAAPGERPSCLNLNSASVEELMRLPGVGEVLARRIISYREQRGPLRRPQEIIIIDGFSERKYRALAELVCVE